MRQLAKGGYGLQTHPVTRHLSWFSQGLFDGTKWGALGKSIVLWVPLCSERGGRLQTEGSSRAAAGEESAHLLQARPGPK